MVRVSPRLTPPHRPAGDGIYKGVTAAAAVILVGVGVGIVISLIANSRLTIREQGLGFLFSKAWDPISGDYGALTSLFGTVVSTAIAILIALPMGIVIALFLAELVPASISKWVSAAIELLASVPSIIYGMWGLFVFAPFMADLVQPSAGSRFGPLALFRGPNTGIGMLTAGIILALMVLPFITAVIRDVFRMVPAVLKEAAYGMGATTLEVTLKVTLRYGASGIAGAVFLGLGRALGETMAVTFVIGNSHEISPSLFSAGASIASTLANEFTEASDPMHASALIELGLLLFCLTMTIHILAHVWLKKAYKNAGGGV